MAKKEEASKKLAQLVYEEATPRERGFASRDAMLRAGVINAFWNYRFETCPHCGGQIDRVAQWTKENIVKVAACLLDLKETSESQGGSNASSRCNG